MRLNPAPGTKRRVSRAVLRAEETAPDGRGLARSRRQPLQDPRREGGLVDRSSSAREVSFFPSFWFYLD